MNIKSLKIIKNKFMSKSPISKLITFKINLFYLFYYFYFLYIEILLNIYIKNKKVENER